TLPPSWTTLPKHLRRHMPAVVPVSLTNRASRIKSPFPCSILVLPSVGPGTAPPTSPPPTACSTSFGLCFSAFLCRLHLWLIVGIIQVASTIRSTKPKNPPTQPAIRLKSSALRLPSSLGEGVEIWCVTTSTIVVVVVVADMVLTGSGIESG